MKIHNFSAGPCILPQTVYKEASQAILNFNETGLSILEISHRSKEFISIINEARELSLTLLGLDSSKYTALFLQGGASMEFFRVPFNLLKSRAAYIDTGTWSTKAIIEARKIGNIEVIASSKDEGYTYIPANYNIDSDFDYLHFTSNNTIYGTQFTDIPKTDIPLVCDMSSDIFSRKFNYDKIDLIYAGAQKNIGPAGLGLVIVNNDILGKTDRIIPNILDYRQHIESDNLYNTQNVFAIYTSLLNLKWLNNLGGVEEIERLNNAKAKAVYDKIDSLDFIEGIAKKEFRSKMNITFRFKDSQLEKTFDKYCMDANIVNIKGHRSIGGYRASLYNALPMESVKVLLEVFESVNNKA